MGFDWFLEDSGDVSGIRTESVSCGGDSYRFVESRNEGLAELRLMVYDGRGKEYLGARSVYKGFCGGELVDSYVDPDLGVGRCVDFSEVEDVVDIYESLV